MGVIGEDRGLGNHRVHGYAGLGCTTHTSHFEAMASCGLLGGDRIGVDTAAFSKDVTRQEAKGHDQRFNLMQ